MDRSTSPGSRSLRAPRRARFCFVAVLATSCVSFSANAAEPRPFYAGKTITIVVGLPPGGGADAYARLVQRHLPRHIPGSPTIVVQNVPGAGSLSAVTYLTASMPADGTALGTFSSALLNEALIAPNRVTVDFRTFGWIGNVSEDVRVCYVWGGSGVSDMARDARPRQGIVHGRDRAGHRGQCRHRNAAEPVRREAQTGARLFGQRRQAARH